MTSPEAIVLAALRAAKELAVRCDHIELLTQFRDAENCLPLIGVTKFNDVRAGEHDD